MTVYQALLAFAIGPVQPFIAAARRTQDLFVGSKILSYLASVARDKLNVGDNLIYPPAGAKSANITNKLLADFGDTDKARAAGEAAEKAVREAWQALATLVYAYLASLMEHSKLQLNNEMWDGQVRTALEVYWAVLDPVTLATLPGAYNPTKLSDQVEAAESLLAARKLVRGFDQYRYGNRPDLQQGPMSSIGGERPALRATTTQPTSHEVKQFWKELGQQLKDNFERNNRGPAGAVLNLEGNEQLDSVSTIKRLLGEAMIWAIRHNNKYRELADHLRETFWVGKTQQPQYPSTSDIAAADLRAGIIEHNAELSKELDNYSGVLRSVNVKRQREGDIPDLVRMANKLNNLAYREALLRYDGDLLFPASISQKMLEDDYGISVFKEIVSQLAKDAGDLLRAARKVGVYCTSPYYAAVALDGDRMGALLRQAEQHRKLSEALADFAGGDVPRIAEKEGRLGRVVYAGGEDVLALFPLTTVLPAMVALLKQYRERVTIAMGIAKDKTDKLGNPLATASVGIVIAHHLTPLDFVLKEVRAAEHEAKETFGRNAIAMHILRRSGQHTTAGYQFGFSDGNVQHDQLQVISNLSGYIARDELSSRFVYDFGREAHALSTHEMAMSELRRLLYRHNSFDRNEEDGMVDELLNGKLNEKKERVGSGLAALYRQLPQLTPDKKDKALLQASAQQRGISYDEALAQWQMVKKSEQLSQWLGVAEFIARGGQEG